MEKWLITGAQGGPKAICCLTFPPPYTPGPSHHAEGSKPTSYSLIFFLLYVIPFKKTGNEEHGGNACLTLSAFFAGSICRKRKVKTQEAIHLDSFPACFERMGSILESICTLAGGVKSDSVFLQFPIAHHSMRAATVASALRNISI